MAELSVQICFIVVLLIATATSARKPKSLAMFHLMSNNYDGVTTGVSCKAANEIALAAVNSRDDILPGYHLYFDYFAEGDGSIVPTSLFQYLFNFDDNHKNGTTLAPILLGISQAPGCAPTAQLMHHVDMIAITSACGDPMFTGNKIDFPNFFRGTFGLEYLNFPQLMLMKYANWNKIAIMTYANNKANYRCAELMYDKALQAGLEVVHFDSTVDNSDDVIQRLKDSDARIIAYEGQVAGQVYELLCRAYKFGIRGPKYAFVIWAYTVDDLVAYPAYVQPLPNPCTYDILKAQWAITFWAGTPFANITGNNGATDLGYDLPAFEQLFNNYTNNTIYSDYTGRLSCYDTAELGILALDRAERLLQSQNATLSDYTTNSSLVSNALRTIMPSIKLTNLQYGLVSYDSRGEFDNKPLYLFQTMGTGRVALFWKVTWDNVKYNWTAVVPEDFSFHQVNPIIWPTPNGQPPKDFPGNLKLEDRITTALFSVIVAIAAAGSLMHLTAVAATKFAVSRSGPGITLIKATLAVACLSLNTAACLFAVNPEGFSHPEVLCYLQRAFLVSGESMLSGCLAGIMSRFFQLVTKKKIRLIRRRVATVDDLQLNNNAASATALRRRNHVYIGVCSCLCVLINLVILAAWFGVAQMTVQLQLKGAIYFDEILDAYVQIEVLQCNSNKSLQFTIVLIVCNFLFNAMASCFAFGNRKYAGQVAGFPLFPAEVRLVRFASWNGTMTFLLTVFIVAIMGFQFGPVEQNIALSFLILASSLSTSAIIAIPMAIMSRGTMEEEGGVVMEASFHTVQGSASGTIITGGTVDD